MRRRALVGHTGGTLRNVTPSIVLDGVTYFLDWEDDFPGTTLNSDNWHKIEPGVNWGGGENDIFDITEADPYVEDSMLKLPIYYNPTSMEWFQSGVVGADQINRTVKQDFAPPFIFEARVKVPVGVIPDGETDPAPDDVYRSKVWAAVWMLGTYPTIYGLTDANGDWPSLGEWDVFEFQQGEKWRDGGGEIARMAWANLHHQLNSKAQEDPPVSWDQQHPKQIEGSTLYGDDFNVVRGESFYDSQNGDKLTIRSYLDDVLVSTMVASDSPTNWASYTDNTELTTFDRVDWGGDLASDPQTFDNGPLGSPFEYGQYFIINIAKGGGGPVAQGGACWEENSGLEFWVDWIRVYKP